MPCKSKHLSLLTKHLDSKHDHAAAHCFLEEFDATLLANLKSKADLEIKVDDWCSNRFSKDINDQKQYLCS